MNKILLVEDEIELTKIIRLELEKQGFEMFTVQDGAQTLSKFEQCQPDLVILDWILPGMNGLDILRELRKLSPVPVLMLTARSSLVDKVVGLEAGADDYLAKPFNLSELVARIRALLRHEERIRETLSADQGSSQKSLKYKELVLDSLIRVCKYQDEIVDLTTLEFDLLSLLLAHPGRTFNRNYLVETIWKTAYFEGDRSVDNTILRLRKKLGSAGGCIETVRGWGYRVKADK